MRRQCNGAFRYLVRHCQMQSNTASMITNSSCLQRRITFMAATCNRYNNSNIKYGNPVLHQRLLTESRSYSKFSHHLNSERAMELLYNLDEEERNNLRDAMQKIEADKNKKFYESKYTF
ncbi:hypothetical protein ACLKA7_002437 [Drosophila subpalustris]